MTIKTSEIESFFDKSSIDDFKDHFDNNFQGWSYDLCLGSEVYITSEKIPRILTEHDPYVSIKPGDFALLITYEKLDLKPDVMAFISVKFSYKKKGLINISGFHVDPNYKGRIIFSVYNAGPSDILLKFKDPVFMIFFENLDCECPKSRGDGYKHIPATMISEIKGQSSSLAENRQKLEQLEHLVKLYGGIAIAIIVSLLGVIIKELFIKK